MDPMHFTSQRTGAPAPIPGGLHAFVPHHLPPTISLDLELVRMLTEAQGALSAVDAAVSVLPNPALALTPLLYGELSSSCRIEGSPVSWDEALQLPLEDVPEESEAYDILNCRDALQLGLTDLAVMPLTSGLLGRVHALVMRGIRSSHVQPGELREIQIFVGVRRGRLSSATYVPPPWQEVQGLMADLERYACEDRELPTLLQCGILHAQFEMIHPFRDGNGKLGRLLMPLFLYARRALKHPVVFLSPHFERNRREYYHRLRGISHHGEWEKWLMFFLDGVIHQSRDILDCVTQIAALREQTRAQLIGGRGAGTVLRLLDMLIENPYATTSSVAQGLEVTVPTARGALTALQNIGFIEEITGRKRGQKYCASGVLDIILGHD
ncbi:MAG: Fic family protein [Armatimonadota bacterium]